MSVTRRGYVPEPEKIEPGEQKKQNLPRADKKADVIFGGASSTESTDTSPESSPHKIEYPASDDEEWGLSFSASDDSPGLSVRSSDTEPEDILNLDDLLLRSKIVEQLQKFNRASLYADLQGKDRDALLQQLRSIVLVTPDTNIKKGAQHVLGAYYQGQLLEAQKANNLEKIKQILAAADQDEIPAYKLIKDYQSTTGTNIGVEKRRDLYRSILRSGLENAVLSGNPDDIKTYIRKLCLVPGVDSSWLLQTFNELTLPDYEDIRVTLQGVHGLYEGKETNDPEAINLARMLAETNGETTPVLEAALDRLLVIVANEASPLAVELYEALCSHNTDEIHEIMSTVERSSFAQDFHIFLRAVIEGREGEGHEMAKRICSIYEIMNSVPIKEHHMSPYELVNCALVAEKHFSHPTGPEVSYKKEDDVPTHVVDLSYREVTFLPQARGSMYIIGGDKKITSAITIQVIPEGFWGYLPLQSRPRTDSLGAVEWTEEVAAMQEYRGLEGLLSYQTIVDYTTRVGEIDHPRQMVLLKKYDLGNFAELSTTTSIERHIANYSKIAAGLNNMHNFQEIHNVQERQDDGSYKSVLRYITVPRVHCDIKRANMVAASDGDAVLMDYGRQFRPTVGEEMHLYTTYYGTPSYSAPEFTLALIDGTFKKKDPLTFDIFAVGVSMLESIGIKPKSMALQQQYYHRYGNSIIPLNKAQEIDQLHRQEYNTAMTEILKKSKRTTQDAFLAIAWKMVHPDPAQRPTAARYKQLMDHLQSLVIK